jgi:hypothetical protein
MTETKDITVLFVPFFGGSKPALKQHIEFVESLGFKTEFVDLEFSLLRIIAKPFSAQTLHFGMKALWADQIEVALNRISGNKIIYSFSNPTAGAIEAIGRRTAHDILGLVADGGPSGELWSSLLSYYTHEKPIRFLPAKYLAATLSALLLSPELNHLNDKDLAKFPEGFRLLSVRGWKDPLISPRQIDLIFEPHKQLAWQKLALPDGGHLNGLKDFREDYAPAVEQFLKDLLRSNKIM